MAPAQIFTEKIQVAVQGNLLETNGNIILLCMWLGACKDANDIPSIDHSYSLVDFMCFMKQ